MELMEWPSSVSAVFKRMSKAISTPVARASDQGELPHSVLADIVPLTRAVICIDCEAITQGIHQCPACGSPSLLSVARILNRTAGYSSVRAEVLDEDVPDRAACA